MGNTLIVLGIGIAVLGVIINFLSQHGLPTLPGDILIQKENFTFYFKRAKTTTVRSWMKRLKYPPPEAGLKANQKTDEC